MESIFRIVTLKNKKSLDIISNFNENDILELGTGFFIDENGHFLTAGHVVIDYKTNQVIAIYNEKLYKIEHIVSNYPGHNRHIEKIRDFAFGKIDIKVTSPLKISFNSEIKIGESIEIKGYTMETNAKGAIIDITQSKFTIIPSIFFNSHYELPKGIFNGKEYGGIIENAFVICYMEKRLIPPRGMSGGPILNQHNEVIGIFVSGTIKTGTGVIINDIITEIKKNLKN